MSRIVVTGSSGLIGTPLVAALTSRGDEVVRLVRRTPRAADEVQWDPTSRTLDPSTLDGVLDRFGPDHVMVEVDYPHADSTWPDTQELLGQRLAHLPDDEVAKLTHRNAEELFRWAP